MKSIPTCLLFHLLGSTFVASTVHAVRPEPPPWWDVTGAETIIQTVDVNGDGVPDLELWNYKTWEGDHQRLAIEYRHNITLQTLGSTQVLFANTARTQFRVLAEGDVIPTVPSGEDNWHGGQYSLGTVKGYALNSINSPLEQVTDLSPWNEAPGYLGVKVSGLANEQVGWIFLAQHLSNLQNQGTLPNVPTGAAAPLDYAAAGLSQYVLPQSGQNGVDLNGDGSIDLIVERRWQGPTNESPAAVFLITRPGCEILGTATDDIPDLGQLPGEPPRDENGPITEARWATGIPYRHWVRLNPLPPHVWLPTNAAHFLRLTNPAGEAKGPLAAGTNIFLAVRLPRTVGTMTGWLEINPHGEVVRKLTLHGEQTFPGDTIGLGATANNPSHTVAIWDLNQDRLVDLQQFQPGTPWRLEWQPDHYWYGTALRVMEPGLIPVWNTSGNYPAPVAPGARIDPCPFESQFGEYPYNIAGQIVYPTTPSVSNQNNSPLFLPLRVSLPDGCHAGWFRYGKIFINPEPGRAIMAGYYDDDTVPPELAVESTGSHVRFSWPTNFLGFELFLLDASKPTNAWVNVRNVPFAGLLGISANQVTMPANHASLRGPWLFRLYRPQLGVP